MGVLAVEVVDKTVHLMDTSEDLVVEQKLDGGRSVVVAARDHCMMDEEASTGQEELLIKKEEDEVWL